MLYSTGAGQFVRVHGAFVSDEEVVAVAEALRQEGAPNYVDGITDAPPASDGASGTREASEDDLYDRAVAVVLRDGKASTSYIQRRLSIGYNRAADLIERMEREGLISAANAVGRREILVARGGGADAAA
jgi:S-DNA-T family DNA segregation ATPase FtsK/SpoIIIE